MTSGGMVFVVDDESVRRARSRFIRLVLLGALLGLLGLTPSALAAEPEARSSVLLLYAEARLLPAIVATDVSIRSTLQSGSESPVHFYTEYLDLSWFPGEGHERQLRNLLRQKYANRKLDLVIPAGAHALRFALKHRASLFPGVPIVFCAVDKPSVAGLELGPDVTGVWMSVDWSATLDVALRLQPDTRRVIVIQGASDLDRRLAAQAREAFSTYQGRIEFTYLIGLPMEQLLKEVAALPDRTVVVFGSLLREGAGRTFVPMEALSLIAPTSRAPIYGLFDTLVGGGIVGGRVVSFQAQGVKAAELGLRALRGQRVEPADQIDQNPNVYMFDWRQLRRWGISEDRLPPGSVVRYKEPSTWDLYKWHIAGAVTLVVAQTLLIAGLLVQRTKRRRLQLSLRETQDRFRLMADSAPVMMWMSGPDTRCTHFNRRWLEFTGRPLERELGDGWSEGVHPDDLASCLAAYRRAFEARREFTLEYRLRRFDGEYRWVLDHGAARFGPDGSFSGYIGSCIDVTEQRQAEEAAREHREELAHALRVTTMGELAASLAHEINQPLAAIMSNAQAARRLLDGGRLKPDELGEVLGDISGEAGRAAQVIRRLRALFRKDHAEHKPLDINGLITEVATLLRHDIERRRITMQLSLAEGLPPLSGDPILLEQVILNLLVNAREAMADAHEGPRELTIQTAQREPGNLNISVGDTGAGVKESELERIFDPFVSTKAEGLGMGLSISRSIIEAHGGRIWATCNPDRGITVHAELPCEEDGTPP